MDLFGSSPSSAAPRAGNSPASPPAAARPSSARETIPSASRAPARLSNSTPSRLPASSPPSRNVAAVAPPPSSAPAQSSAAPQAQPSPFPNQPQNAPIALAAASQSSPSSSTSQPACKNSNDCPSKVCISGVCQISSGFALSISTASSANSHSGSHTSGGYKSKFGTPTACSDPRCTLPAAITSLNGAEEKDISASLGSHERAVSSAATAGIVLAFLFATLAVLLVVPKIRDWAKKCFGCTKEDNGIVLDNDGSPEFGNHHASAFINEKRQTLATESNGSYGDRAGSRNGHNQGFSEYDDYLPGYEGGQGDIADVKVDLKQEEYYGGYYTDNNNYQPQNYNHGAPVLPALDYDRSYSTRDLASYVESNPPPPLPSSKSAPMQLSRATPAPAQYVPPISKSANITPWASNGRQAQVRETVLPYTVEEDRDALMGLRTLGTSTVNDFASNNQPFNDTRDAYTTPVMRNNGFDNSLASPQTPITPGSAYSVRTQLLPASLRPGQGQGQGYGAHGRAPILKQGLAASRPAFRRLSNALRFDSNTKSS